MILTNLKNLFGQSSKLFASVALLALVGCSSTPFMQNNIAATKYLLDNLLKMLEEKDKLMLKLTIGKLMHQL